MKPIALIGIGTILLVIALSQLVILPTTPKQNEIITDRTPSFTWLGKASHLIIDDNKEFTTPRTIELEENNHELETELDFGKYYWKLKGLTESQSKTFTIDSIVNVESSKDTDSIQLQNTGNTAVKIKQNRITGFSILDQEQSIEFPNQNQTITITQHE